MSEGVVVDHDDVLHLDSSPDASASSFQTYRLHSSLLKCLTDQPGIQALPPDFNSALGQRRGCQSNQLLGECQGSLLAYDGRGLHSYRMQGSPALLCSLPNLRSAVLCRSTVCFSDADGKFGFVEIGLDDCGSLRVERCVASVTIGPELDSKLPGPWYLESAADAGDGMIMVGLVSGTGVNTCCVGVAGLLPSSQTVELASAVMIGKSLPYAVAATPPVVAVASSCSFESEDSEDEATDGASYGHLVYWAMFTSDKKSAARSRRSLRIPGLMGAWISKDGTMELAVRRHHCLNVHALRWSLNGMEPVPRAELLTSYPGLAYVHRSRRSVKYLFVNTGWACVAEEEGIAAVSVFARPCAGQAVAATAFDDHGVCNKKVGEQVLGVLLRGSELIVLRTGSLRRSNIDSQAAATMEAEVSLLASTGAAVDGLPEGIDRTAIERALAAMDGY